MKGLRAFFAPAFALALAGCGGVVIYESPAGKYGYDAGEFDYANRKGAMHTVIAGNPFGGDRAGFESRVIALMQGENRGLPATFVATAGPQTDPQYKTVVAFDLATGVPADDVCRTGAGLASRPQAGRTRVTMVFCDGGRAKSSASGVVQEVGGIDDPKFARLVRQTTYFMVPDDGLVEYLRNNGQ